LTAFPVIDFQETAWRERRHLLLFSEAVQRFTDGESISAWSYPTRTIYAALNSAVFTDVRWPIPKGVRPMELSTYFRINAANTASSGARYRSRGRPYVATSRFDGMMRDENQLHAAVVNELSH
jgi:Fe-S cluster assembly scaffold protein SufB